MAGRPRGSTNTKTTTPHARPGTRAAIIPRMAGTAFWTGGHIYQAYPAQNAWGCDVQIQNGATQPLLLSALCPQAMDVVSAVFAQTGLLTGLANRSVAGDASYAIPIDGNQNGQTGSSVVRRVRKHVSGSRTPVTSSSSSS